MRTSLSGPHALGPVAWVLESWLEAVREWRRDQCEDTYNEAGIGWTSLITTPRNLNLCLWDSRAKNKRKEKTLKTYI